MLSKSDLEQGLRKKNVAYRAFFWWCFYTSFGGRTILFVGFPILFMFNAAVAYCAALAIGAKLPTDDWFFGVLLVGVVVEILLQRLWINSRIQGLVMDR